MLFGLRWCVWYLIKSALHANTSLDIYVCIACNRDNEAKKPWLLQHQGDPPRGDGPHIIQHTLALAIDSSAAPEPELTTENRLDQLEKKFEEQAVASRELRDRFENHEKVMQERMEEMSRLLHQVLANKVQSSSS